MDRLLALLKKEFPNVDFESADNLIDDGVIDSVDVVNIISKIEDEFGVEVTMEYIQPDYFQSAKCMWEMIEELM